MITAVKFLKANDEWQERILLDSKIVGLLSCLYLSWQSSPYLPEPQVYRLPRSKKERRVGNVLKFDGVAGNLI